MSSLARWAYKNTATVWKFLGRDELKGGSSWSEPFQIACYWASENKSMEDANGKEFVSDTSYFHEDKRVAFGDRIKRGTHTDANPLSLDTDTIRRHSEWDRSMFGKREKAFPDFRSVT